MQRKEELQRQIRVLREELDVITSAEDAVRDAALVGQYFKIRDNYSCPKTQRDYWWIYIKVLCCADGGLRCMRFQIDSFGVIIIDTSYVVSANTLNRYSKIKSDEFQRAWARCVQKVSKILVVRMPPV